MSLEWVHARSRQVDCVRRDGANFARSPNLLSLGDRFALAWADDRQTFGHYGVRFEIYSPNFTPLSTVETLAETAYDCVEPVLANGGLGLALVYRERNLRSGGISVYCQSYANRDFICRSTGGGAQNRKVCLPNG
jgi:hypothetical protein